MNEYRLPAILSVTMFFIAITISSIGDMASRDKESKKRLERIERLEMAVSALEQEVERCSQDSINQIKSAKLWQQYTGDSR